MAPIISNITFGALRGAHALGTLTTRGRPAHARAAARGRSWQVPIDDSGCRAAHSAPNRVFRRTRHAASRGDRPRAASDRLTRERTRARLPGRPVALIGP